MNRFSRNSYGWCGSTHGWTLLFWNQSAQQNHRYGGKRACMTSFSGLSQTVWSFLGKKLKYLVPYFPSKNIILIFVVRRPLPSEMIVPPKNNFSLLLRIKENIVFFEKVVKWKIFKTSMPTKKVILIFVARRFPPRQNAHVLPQMCFSLFSPLFFPKNLWYNKTSVT